MNTEEIIDNIKDNSGFFGELIVLLSLIAMFVLALVMYYWLEIKLVPQIMIVAIVLLGALSPIATKKISKVIEESK